MRGAGAGGDVTAAGVLALGGDQQLRMWPRDDAERAEIKASPAAADLGRIYYAKDLVTSPSAIFCATGVTNGVLLGMTYYAARASLMRQIQSTVLSIADTTAALMDVDRYLQIKVRADETSPVYQEVEAYLRRARDANRRQDVRLKYIYIIAQDTKNPRAAHFVVDAEEEGENKSHFGEAYKSIDTSNLDFP